MVSILEKKNHEVLELVSGNNVCVNHKYLLVFEKIAVFSFLVSSSPPKTLASSFTLS